VDRSGLEETWSGGCPSGHSTGDDRLRFFTVYETAGFVGMSKPSAFTVPPPAPKRKRWARKDSNLQKSGLASRGLPRRNVGFSNMTE